MQLDQLKLKHNFVVVDRLVVLVILKVDFLQNNGLALYFTTKAVMVRSSSKLDAALFKIPHTLVLSAAFHSAQRREEQVMAIAVENEPSTDVVDECAVHSFGDTAWYELQECPLPSST